MTHSPNLPSSTGLLTHPRRLLDDLLMSPLDAAVPLKQVDSVAVHVPEDLNLDVSAVVETDRRRSEGERETPTLAGGGGGHSVGQPDGGWGRREGGGGHLGSSTNFSTSMTSSLKDFLASLLADSSCSKKSASVWAMRIPWREQRRTYNSPRFLQSLIPAVAL